MPITYSKLRDGSWGVRSDSELRPDTIVTVTKKSGGQKQERIGRVLWTDRRTWLAAIVSEAGRSGRSARRASVGYWECPACGEENPHSSTSCWECGCGK